MNTTHLSGAVAGTCSPLKRRVIPLLVLVTLLCFSVGEFATPPAAQAAPDRTAVSSAKKTPAKKVSASKAPSRKTSGRQASARKGVKKTAVAAPKRKRPVYVRSLMSEEDRAALRERGISSGFGARAISRKATRMHKGIDIPGPKDSKVVAFNDGEVIFTGTRNGYGKTVIVRQLDGREALYAHMNKYVVSIGDSVKRGDHIGHVGRTGRATGYHLHFEIIDDGENLDPALHVWHGTELVLGPSDLDPRTVDQTRVAEPNRRSSRPVY